MTSRTSKAAALCLLLALGLAAAVGSVRDVRVQEDDVAPGLAQAADASNGIESLLATSGSSSRLLLQQGGALGPLVLAAGAMGSLVQYDEPIQAKYGRALLSKDDDDEDDDDQDDDDDEDDVSTKITAIVGMHIKEFKPKNLRKVKEEDDDEDDDDEDDDDDDDDEEEEEEELLKHKKKKKKKGHKKKGHKKKRSNKNDKLLRDDDGELVFVETPVSPRFAFYLGREPEFLDRIAYLGTVKRQELNSICKKVAKGKTKFKTDVNVDEATGAPDTGDDITDAKVDHQFGCTITKGPRVKMNPHLKTGAVFALLELGDYSNLIDCQAGVRKCNMWQLLHNDDVEELTDMYGNERRLLSLSRQNSAGRIQGSGQQQQQQQQPGQQQQQQQQPGQQQQQQQQQQQSGTSGDANRARSRPVTSKPWTSLGPGTFKEGDADPAASSAVKKPAPTTGTPGQQSVVSPVRTGNALVSGSQPSGSSLNPQPCDRAAAGKVCKDLFIQHVLFNNAAFDKEDPKWKDFKKDCIDIFCDDTVIDKEKAVRNMVQYDPRYSSKQLGSVLDVTGLTGKQDAKPNKPKANKNKN